MKRGRTVDIQIDLRTVSFDKTPCFVPSIGQIAHGQTQPDIRWLGIVTVQNYPSNLLFLSSIELRYYVISII